MSIVRSTKCAQPSRATCAPQADSSKFERKAGQILCGLNPVSCVIADTGVPDGTVQMLGHYGVRVVAVEPDRGDAGADPDAAGAAWAPDDHTICAW